jgi:hypothetical protein
MTDMTLAQAVETFVTTTAALPDEALEREWQWRAHDEEGVRFAFFVTYQELRELAALAAAERAARGPTQTLAQRILAQHHAAYRDLHGVLAGVDDDLLDREPTPGEWPLRAVLEHVVGTEHGFFAVVSHALERHRRGEPLERTPRDSIFTYHPEITFDGTLPQILARYDELHAKILRRFADLDEGDLAASSLWWEGYPVELGFRLHRFDAHLRQHTIQVEKTLAGVDHQLTEARRLLRLLYGALGEVEGALIGAPDGAADRQREVASAIAERAAEIAGLVGAR